MLLLVTKDEGELLRLNIEHHLASGFDQVAVADNFSTDGLKELSQPMGVK